MKTNKTWRLPPPEKLSSGLKWFPVVRVGRVVPFGYEQDPNCLLYTSDAADE